MFIRIQTSNSNRLVQIDALRGLAALAVVLFHYTVRFGEVFSTRTFPSFSFPFRDFGIDLFFIISGFVIFMTLEKTSRSMDFIISRFSRLFPAYWVSIFLTFSICHLIGLPGHLVSIESAFANMLMLHSFLGVTHVDGVYWTLEVELLFYAGMFALYKLKSLDRIYFVLLCLMLLKVIYYLSKLYFGIDLPWIVFRLLILEEIPWFAIGISVYLAVNRKGSGAWRQTLYTLVPAIVALWICQTALVAILAIAIATVVYLAAQSRLTFLQFKPIVWLGTVSYPLYLLHENIGWSLMLQLQKMGLSMDITIFITLCVSLSLAAAVTFWVEQPAMRWIRSRYKNRAKLLAVQ